jgi:hypothetical protein
LVVDLLVATAVTLQVQTVELVEMVLMVVELVGPLFQAIMLVIQATLLVVAVVELQNQAVAQRRWVELEHGVR